MQAHETMIDRTLSKTIFEVEFDRLVEIRPRLVDQAAAVVRRRDVAEEVVQEVLVRLWEGRITFDPTRGSLKSWLLVVTRRAAIDVVRHEIRQQRNAMLGDGIARPFRSPEDAIELLSERQELEDMLDTIPSEQREAIELAFLAELSQQSVAARLEQPLGTVKSRIRRGIRSMAATSLSPV